MDTHIVSEPTLPSQSCRKSDIRHLHGKVLHLVPPCKDTINAVEQLLQLARDGTLQGLAFVGFYRNREAVKDATGVAYEDPARALGYLHVLQSDLEDLTRGRVPEGW
jgi:hypothetical protein